MMPEKPRYPRYKMRPLHVGLSVLAALLITGGLYLAFTNLRNSKAELPANPSGKVWQQVWSDEFNGSGVDGSKWNTLNNNTAGSQYSEDACYMNRNATVGGGVLKLTAKRETVTCGGNNPDGSGKTYYFTSAQVNTRAQDGAMKYKFKQGYIEARMKAPKGNPYWVNFWLGGPLDGSTPGWPDYGEFDVSQIAGIRPDVTFGMFQYKCPSGHCATTPDQFNIKANSAAGVSGAMLDNSSAFNSYSGGTTNFHNYGLWWEGSKLTWYVDGRRVRYFDGQKLYRIEPNGSQTQEKTVAQLGDMSIPMDKVLNNEHSIILGLGFGGSLPIKQGYTGKGTSSGYSNGNLVANIPGTLEVDYVRVFQLANAPSAPSSQPQSAPPSSNGSEDDGEGGFTPSGDYLSEDDSIFADAPEVEDTEGIEVSVAEDNTVVDGDTVITPQLATDPSAQQNVKYVEFLVNDKLRSKVTKAPFTFDTTTLPDGTYNLTEKVYYKDGKVQVRTAYIVVRNKKPLPPLTKSTAKAGTSHTVWWMVGGTIVALLLVVLIIPRTRQIITGFIGRVLHRNNPY